MFKNPLRIAGAAALTVALTVPVAGAAIAAPAVHSNTGTAVRMAASSNYVYGTIYGPNNKPIGGITLQLLTSDGTIAGSDVSDSTGHFQIDAPAAGLYDVKLVANSSSLQTSQLPLWVEGATRDSEQIMAATKTATVKPRIKRVPQVGNTLRATWGKWPSKHMMLSMQWLLDGQPIDGAQVGYYTVQRSDLGHQLSVQVTGQQGENGAPTTVTSKAVTVTKGVSQVTVKTPGKVAAGHQLVVTGRVQTRIRPVSGTVSLVSGSTVVTTATITSAGAYSLTATVPAGRHVYQVRYSGDATFNSSASHKITVTVAGSGNRNSAKGHHRSRHHRRHHRH